MTEKCLEGRLAIVTGASRGLGKEMAEALAGAGADVVLVARGAELLEKVRAGILDRGGNAYAVTADVGQESEVRRLADYVRAGPGVPDILINNAGINLRKPLCEFTLTEWHHVMAVNLDGPFLCTRAFAPGMVQKKFGRIVNVTSTMAHVSLAGRSAYSATKFGLLGMTKALALELAPHGVTVNGISPGPFPTEINTALLADSARAAEFTAKIPVGRWGEMREIRALVVFLCSDESGFITGTDILIDGGWTAQ